MFLYIDALFIHSFVCILYEVLPFSFLLSCGCAVLIIIDLFIKCVLGSVHNHITLTLIYIITQPVEIGVFTPKRLLSNAIFIC